LLLFCPLHDQRPTQTDAVAVCSLVFLQHLAIEKGESRLVKHRIKGAEIKITSAVGRNGLAVRLDRGDAATTRPQSHLDRFSLAVSLSVSKSLEIKSPEKRTRGAIVKLRGGPVVVDTSGQAACERRHAWKQAGNHAFARSTPKPENGTTAGSA
jgi:hypothetical protein